MLRALSIQNFILIDNLVIDFYEGLTALTGETGAGKSIILDALGLIVGNRANLALIKDKARPAVLAAEFNIANLSSELKQKLFSYGIDGNELILKRIISFDGKGRVFINNVLSSVSQLKSLANYLLEICGQHDKYGLLNEAEHLIMLDEFANLENKKLDLQRIFNDYKSKKEHLSWLIELKNKSLEEKSYLEYITAEIDELNYVHNEEEGLESKKKKLLSLEKLKALYTLIETKLTNENNGVLNSLYVLQKALIKMPEYFGKICNLLNEAVLILEEVLEENNNLISDEETHESIAAIEDRIFKIKNLARKHGIMPNQILEFLANKKQKLRLIGNIDDKIIEAEALLIIAKNHYLEYANIISSERRQNAKMLRDNIILQFQEIKMDKADFAVEINNLKEEQWSGEGIDEVRFLVKTNPGMPWGRVADVASGGELSRIMLACKIVMSKHRVIPVMIFDEIDSGISGAVSTSVGRKLLMFSKLSQVLIVTHQPQVAVFADHHYLVTKMQQYEAVNIDVKLLNEKMRVKEVARMISDDHITEEAENAARSLFKKVNNSI